MDWRDALGGIVSIAAMPAAFIPFNLAIRTVAAVKRKSLEPFYQPSPPIKDFIEYHINSPLAHSLGAVGGGMTASIGTGLALPKYYALELARQTTPPEVKEVIKQTPVLGDIVRQEYEKLRYIEQSKSWPQLINRTLKTEYGITVSPESIAMTTPKGWELFTAGSKEEQRKKAIEILQKYKSPPDIFGYAMSPSLVVPLAATSFVVNPAGTARALYTAGKGGLLYAGFGSALRFANLALSGELEELRKRAKTPREFEIEVAKRVFGPAGKEFALGTLMAFPAAGAGWLIQSHWVVPTLARNVATQAAQAGAYFAGLQAAEQELNEGRITRPENVALAGLLGAGIGGLLGYLGPKIRPKIPVLRSSLYRGPEGKQWGFQIWVEKGTTARPAISLYSKGPSALNLRLGRMIKWEYQGGPMRLLETQGMDPMYLRAITQYIESIPNNTKVKVIQPDGTQRLVNARIIKDVYNTVLKAVQTIYRHGVSPTDIKLENIIRETRLYKHAEQINAAREAEKVLTDFIKQTTGQTAFWRGSAPQKAQIGKYMVREIGDFDPILSKWTGPSKVRRFYEALKAVFGEKTPVRINGDLVEVFVNGRWVHVLNPHYAPSIAEYMGTGSEYVGLGLRPLEPQKTASGHYITDLREQAVRKAYTWIRFGQDGSFGPETHRFKDVADFLAILRYQADALSKTKPTVAKRLVSYLNKLSDALTKLGWGEYVQLGLSSAPSQSLTPHYTSSSVNPFTVLSMVASKLLGEKKPSAPSPPRQTKLSKYLFNKPSEGLPSKPPSELPSEKPAEQPSEQSSESGSRGSSPPSLYIPPSIYLPSPPSVSYLPSSKYTPSSTSVSAPYIPPMTFPHIKMPTPVIPLIRIPLPKRVNKGLRKIKTVWVREVW